jgi:alkylglycerol monooxygenase
MGGANIPYIFAAIMAIELAFNLVKRNGYQTLRGSAVSIMVSLPHYALVVILPVVWMVGYRATSPWIPWHMPANAWWIWPVGIVVMDFAAYWMHRYHHALNLTWATHSVHHSAHEFATPTGGRSAIFEPAVNILSGAYIILMLPVVIGLPLPAAAFGWMIKDTWGFAVHTQTIHTLGWLEMVMATPSHHRVHHASNSEYANKNYGFVFIVWDKLFGTFVAERDEVVPVYGLPHTTLTHRPVAVAFHQARIVWRASLATRRWRDKLRIWYMPAGWIPSDVIATSSHTAALALEPMTPLQIVGSVVHAVTFIAMIMHLSATLADHSQWSSLAYLAFIMLVTISSGELLEHSRHVLLAETIRCAAMAAVIVTTGRWCDRSLDVWSLVIITCSAISLPLAWMQSLLQHTASAADYKSNGCTPSTT